MDIPSLALFVEVARCGSFAGAARGRDLDPSSVSRAVAGLERALGARLFQRTTRTLALTEAGALCLARLPALLDDLERLREEVGSLQGAPGGRVRLTASVAFGQARIVPLLPALRAALPEIRLELRLTDETVDLVAEGIDLAVRLAPSYRADVIGVRLVPTRYRVVAGPSWLRANPLAEPEDLSGRACLLFALPDYRSRWLFRRRGDVRADIRTVPVRGDLEMSSALALREAALAGLGPALLADWLVDADVAAGRLETALPDWEVTATTFDTAAWLLYPSRRHLARKTRAMIDFLRGHLSAGPAAG